MLLAIDAGNTQTVVGLFRAAELVDHWRIATVADRTSDELALMVQQFLGFHGFSFDDSITGVAISSGVPRVTAELRTMVERYFAIEDGGLYRCAHSVIASVVRAEMSATRRREIHRAIALAMIAVAASGDGVADPGEVAQHAEQGGELRIAYTYALAASQASRDRSAFEEAIAWLDLASTCAATPEQTATVDHATATLLEVAGWPEAPAPPRRSPALAISRRDFDLPGA